MDQTFFGLALFVIGTLVAIFNEPLAKTSLAINRRIGGVVVPLKVARVFNFVGGALCSVGGLVLLLRLMEMPTMRH